MKCTVLLLALVPFVVEANRSKRFAALATGIGGAAGCVVTGNKLYANGLELRELTPAEQTELTSYESQVADYKKKVKAAIESHRENLKKQLMSQMSGGNDEQTNNNNKVTEGDENLDAPARPSFCSEATTTQYYFDGCMVQNDKVYVGKTYARDLSADEISQLKTFDEKMTAYQKQVQESIHKQVKGMFGGSDFFASLFGGEVKEAPETTTAAVANTTPEQKLEAPEAPKFCVAI